MKFGQPCRMIFSFGLLTWLGFFTLLQPAQAAPKVRIGGTAKALATAEVHEGGVRIRGRLVDDAGQPVPEGRVRVRLMFGGSAGPFRSAADCDPASNHGLMESAARVEVVRKAGSDGRFCLWLEPLATGQVVLEPIPSPLFSSEPSLVTIDAEKRSLDLVPRPTSTSLSLDQPSHLLHLDLLVTPPFKADDPGRSILLEVSLVRGEEQHVLADLEGRPGEQVTFELDSKALAKEGSAELKLRYPGSAWLKPADASLPLHILSSVALSVEFPLELRVGESERAEVLVRSHSGAVDEGLVEVRALDEVLAVAPVHQGKASPIISLERPGQQQLLRFSYVSATPFLVPGSAKEIQVNVIARRDWSGTAWLLGAAIAATWILTAWWRPLPRRVTGASPSNADGQAPVPRLALVRAGSSRDGWVGHIVDAHTEEPISGARVSLKTPSFSASGVLGSVVTDRTGSFRLPWPPGGTPATITVEAPWHVLFAGTLPEPGEILIRMVSRRRSLLDELVKWAERQGRPWTRPKDPTPGYVSRVASRQLAPNVATWARTVEEAAFGPGPIDEETERSVRAQGPG